MASSSSILRAIWQFTEDLFRIPNSQSLDRSLENAALAEHELRLLFQAGHEWSDPHLGLIDLFGLRPFARRTRRRQVNDENFAKHHIFPLTSNDRREDLTQSTVPDLKIFKERWNLFTHGSLSKMTEFDWRNIIVAGGSVLACLMPPRANTSEKEQNEFFHSNTFAASHIDLFLWGLTPKEAESKMKAIYRAVCAAAPWKVTCVRRADMVSIHTTYPYRQVRIALQLYQSPAEILAGIDVDAACCAYDGAAKIWVNPRCLTALVRQANTIDMTRRSPYYEVRLAKYAERGFEVYLPSLERERVKQWLYAPNLPGFPKGLALLLVLEAAHTQSDLYHLVQYSDAGKPMLPLANFKEELRDAQIPYGQLWNARKIKKLVTRKDAWVNSSENPLAAEDQPHTHVLFAGSMRQCLRGRFCEQCDQVNEDNVTSNPAASDPYIAGRIGNSGPQFVIGSFRTQEYEDWVREAYIDRDALLEDHHHRRVILFDSDSDGYPNSARESNNKEHSESEGYSSTEDNKIYDVDLEAYLLD